MRRLPRRRIGSRISGASLLLVLLLALLASGCTSSPAPPVHTGPLPPPPAETVAPRVIEGAPATSLRPPPPALPLGITEDQLPLGLTAEDVWLGITAASILLAIGTLIILASWVTGDILRRQAAAAAAAAASAPAETEEVAPSTIVGTHFPALFVPLDLSHVSPDSPSLAPGPAPALAIAPPPPPEALPAVPHGSMAKAIPVSHARNEGAPPRPMVTPIEPRSTPRPLRVEPPTAPPGPREPPGAPPLAERAARAWHRLSEGIGNTAETTAIGGAYLLAQGRQRTEALAYWLAALPRAAWNDFERRRSAFRDSGEFWVEGTALVRMGVHEDAERHYWGGFYTCEVRAWEVEAAECLRRLGRLAAQRGAFVEALHHFDAAAATFERRGATVRLEAIRAEMRPLQRAVAPPERLSAVDFPAASEKIS